MTATRAPSPRFKRPDTEEGISLTQDDQGILMSIYRHRVIDSSSIYALNSHRSKQVISRRLRRLWLNEFVDRPVQQNLKMSLKAGSDHLAYAIGREGARYLREARGLDVSPSRWTQKNAALRPQTIQHQLSTSRFMVRMATSASGSLDAKMLYADEFVELAKKGGERLAGLPNILRTRIRWYGETTEQGTAPDEIFAIDINGERQVIFLEIDEGTETVEPNDRKVRSPHFWNDTSILRKMAIYAAAFREGTHRHTFGIHAFRVLFVTTSEARAQTMQATYQRHLAAGDLTAPAGLFLFTDWASVADSQDLLSHPLTNGGGRPVLLRR